MVQKVSIADDAGVAQPTSLVISNDHKTSATQLSNEAINAGASTCTSTSTGSDKVVDDDYGDDDNNNDDTDDDDWRASQQLTYIVFKPRNVLSATCDAHGRSTLTCLLRKAGAPLLTGHVGRLDYETSGLMVITTDGRLNRQLRHSVCIYVLT